MTAISAAHLHAARQAGEPEVTRLFQVAKATDTRSVKPLSRREQKRYRQDALEQQLSEWY